MVPTNDNLQLIILIGINLRIGCSQIDTNNNTCICHDIKETEKKMATLFLFYQQ